MSSATDLRLGWLVVLGLIVGCTVGGGGGGRGTGPECLSPANCAAGEDCVGGQCVPGGATDACLGVVCPAGEVCVAGVCVSVGPGDPCQDVVCPAGQECANGQCVPAGTPDPCQDVVCPAGQECANGQCEPAGTPDPCQDVVCPAGQECVNGQCVEEGVQPRNMAIVVDSSLERNMTSSEGSFPLSGQVLVLDDGALPDALHWTVTNDAGSSSGDVPVGADGSWSAQIPLAEGDNAVGLTVPEVQGGVDFEVTYNPGYGFGGQLMMSPDIVYVGEPRTVTAQIALTDEGTDANAVALLRVDGAAAGNVASLTDDGNLENGDEIEGDGIYTGQVTVEEAAETTAEFRVEVGLTGGTGSALSEVYELLVTSHLSDEELNELLAKQSGYQSQLDVAGDIEAAVDDIVAELQADPDVAQVGESDSGRGVWIVYDSGVAGVLYSPESGIKGGGQESLAAGSTVWEVELDTSRQVDYPAYGHYYKPNTALAPGGYTGPAQTWQPIPKNTVKSNKALAIAAQHFDWGDNDDIPMMQQTLQDTSCFSVDYIKYGSKGSGSVEDFKGMGDYGIILISTHGDSFYNGILSLWTDKFGWNGWFGEVIVHSNMTVTAANKATYEDDLKKGRLVLWGSSYGITPSFVRKYAGALPNSLVYMSICRGTWNGTLAQSFLDQGAGTFLGYSDYVAVSFCVATGPPLLNTLLTPDKTMADAFVPGKVETDSDPAEFKLFGANDLSLELTGLQDGSFESNSITQSWSVDGDARIIPALGAAGPTDGSYMAVISTGLGFTTATGTLSQELCLGDNASQISFDWNFFSEEFLEYVGSQYQDSFSVTLTDTDDAANTVTLLYRAIDDLGGEVSEVTNSFDQGGVYATGWRPQTESIPESLRGKRVELRFFATDIGDSIYDTAVLIDNIRITEP